MRRFNLWSADLLGFRPWTRHSLVLFVGGVAHILIGYAYLFITPGGPRAKSIAAALQYAPIETWTFVFWVIGIFAMLSSVWPKSYERWGYTILTGFDAGWSAVYLSTILLTDVTVRENLTLGITWAFVAFMWWGISGLVDPEDIVVVIEDGRN